VEGPRSPCHGGGSAPLRSMKLKLKWFFITSLARGGTGAERERAEVRRWYWSRDLSVERDGLG
jgi:hypothetical protein